MFANGILKDRVAFITGGAGDIGFEIAQAYGTLGAKVVLASRNTDKLAGAQAQLEAQGIEAATHVVDVRDADQVAKAINATVDRFGSLDILVNNAAGNFHCPTAQLSPNGWKTVIDIDLNGTFYGCVAAYEHLKRSKHGGSIISIITMLGVTGWPGAAHAGAAKAGILSLSRTLAVEWGDDNIRVNTISPGPIGDTEGVKRMYVDTGRAELERRKTALGRFGAKSDISNAAVFLASDLASCITGENMVVDGGCWLKYVAA